MRFWSCFYNAIISKHYGVEFPRIPLSDNLAVHPLLHNCSFWACHILFFHSIVLVIIPQVCFLRLNLAHTRKIRASRNKTLMSLVFIELPVSFPHIKQLSPSRTVVLFVKQIAALRHSLDPIMESTCLQPSCIYCQLFLWFQQDRGETISI